jgi:DNA modification methylase
MVQPKNYQPQGRFPANIILSHHPDCKCKGLKKIDEENNEEVWECHQDCPIKIMDEQSGESKSCGGSGENSMGALGKNGKYGKYALNIKGSNIGGLGDTGGASRFFYIAKASKSERNRGLNGFDTKQTKGGGGTYNEEAGAKYGSIKAEGKNFHPTVKPVKLMQYLVRLITPPNGLVLDPFCGSGTTGIACKLENVNFVGMELDAEYSKIAEARILNYTEEPEPELDFIEEEQDNKQLALF